MDIHRKNEEHELTVTDIGNEGEGIGHLDDGYTLFVQGALPGDRICAHIIKAQKKYGIGKLLKIIEPSPDRTVAVCPIADKCGGCQIASFSYEAQLRYKEKKVRELLARVGGFEPSFIDSIFEGIQGCEEPVRFRNKAQYPVGTDSAGCAVTGFYAPHSHRIVPCTDCMIGAPSDGVILNTIREFMTDFGVSPYDETIRRGLIRHIMIRTGYSTGEIQICLVINGEKIPHSDELVNRLIRIEFEAYNWGLASARIASITVCTNTKETNVIMGEDYYVLYGDGYITDKIGDVSFRISPLSFYQVNPLQTPKLYGRALEYAGLSGNETVWDLYCGIGTISLFLAKAAGRVYGVEAVPQAVEDAKENARINGIDNAEFIMGKAEEVLPSFYESADPGTDALHPDVIVVDPPRKGCDGACLDTMLKMKPDRIVYVSCDPATLSRDLKILCETGEYLPARISCTDMFVSSVHVETVALIQRTSGSSVSN